MVIDVKNKYALVIMQIWAELLILFLYSIFYRFKKVFRYFKHIDQILFQRWKALGNCLASFFPPDLFSKLKTSEVCGSLVMFTLWKDAFPDRSIGQILTSKVTYWRLKTISIYEITLLSNGFRFLVAGVTNNQELIANEQCSMIHPFYVLDLWQIAYAR